MLRSSVIVVLAMTLGTGCIAQVLPTAGDRVCKKVGNCMDWESYDVDSCQLDAEEAQDQARSYGCEDRYKLVQKCGLSSGECSFDDESRSFVYETDCEEVMLDLISCMGGGAFDEF